MFPFFSNLVFCPVTLWYENTNFPLIQLITSPSLLTQQCWTPAAVALQWVACAHPSRGAGEQQHRTERGAMGDLNSRDLESCHIPSQMWKQFSGRLRDFFSTQTTYAHQYKAKMHFKLICVFVAKYRNGLQLYSRRAHSLKFYCWFFFF